MAVARERVYIEAPYVQAVAAFERRLGLEPGQAEGECVLALVAPLAAGREVARDVTATTQRLSGAGNFISTYRVAWPTGRTPGGIPTPGFEGTITLRAGEDYNECELELDGRYEPPGGVAGKLFDDLVGRRIAHATLGSLLEGCSTGTSRGTRANRSRQAPQLTSVAARVPFFPRARRTRR
jgi:hypothetical protein